MSERGTSPSSAGDANTYAVLRTSRQKRRNDIRSKGSTRVLVRHDLTLGRVKPGDDVTRSDRTVPYKDYPGG